MPGRRASGSFRPPGRIQGQVAAAALALSLFTGCGEPPVLEVGPVEYTAADVGVLGPGQKNTLAWLTAFGLAVAEDSVDALIAPKVRADIRSLILQRVAMELAVMDSVDEEVLRQAYARDPQHELVVRHLVVLSERWRPPEHRDSARARARAALERIRAGEPFEAVVAEYSDEPGAAERGGRLEPGREGSWVPEFWDAAASLTVGEVSNVVETEFGFHVIRLDERRTVPFEEARDDVVARFVALPQALGHAATWVAGIQDAVRVDTGAIRRWKAGEAAEEALVTWPDSLSIPPYRGTDLEEYIRSARPGSVAEVRARAPAEIAALLEGATRSHILLDRAARQGIDVSESQRAAVRDRWRSRIDRWSEALGFREGMTRQAVKEQAFRALAAPAQSAARARAELPRLAGRLEELYPVSIPPAAPTQ